MCSSTPARTGCRGVPVQAIQRHGSARGAQCCFSSDLSGTTFLHPGEMVIYMSLASEADRELRSLMSHATPIVFVVDDDVSVRESLESLIRFAGWHPETFASAR